MCKEIYFKKRGTEGLFFFKKRGTDIGKETKGRRVGGT